VKAKRRALFLVLVVIRIDRNEALPFFGEVFLGEDGLDGAFVHAEAAVDAGFGVDVEHLEVGFFLDRVDAIHRADGHDGGDGASE
jgi:hypothetical protein